MVITNLIFRNKYSKWYLALCEVASRRANTRKEASAKLNCKVEAHHVLPKSIFPNKNIVYLTLREHFVAHRLLTKMFISEQHKQKMLKALASFMLKSINARQFEVSRIANSQKIPWNKGLSGRKTGPCSVERANKISDSRKKTSKQECIHCKKLIDPGNYKLYHGDNCKLNPNIDLELLRLRSESKKIAAIKSIVNGNHKFKSPNSYGVLQCPHCGKTGINLPNMKRFHFDRCKSYSISDSSFSASDSDIESIVERSC